ncbi:Uncharacterised protein [Actinobacillus seminis]|uniref:Uncharacterized protein n=1 Tax=Actinobacillus seminis TaxID=722 RepID=A0A380VB34_9PAST|nr:hypothetical protein [Actinobacillus seminis]SUU35183.1 Uncharacterised protein [Actinobacillus seminis]
MMSHRILTLYKIDNNPLVDSLNNLEISGKIRFLKSVLLKNSQFKVDDNGDWRLKFFVGKIYEQSFLVSENLDLKEVELSTLSVIIDKYNGFNSEHSEHLSLSIRDNKSIKLEKFLEYSSHYSYIDAKGIAFFSQLEGQQDHFKRHIILQALAYAYLGAIEFITNKLAEKVNCNDCNISDLNDLYIEAAKFNSVFFFYQPVLSKNTGLTEAWRCIDKALEVNISSKELLEQLSMVHYILNLDSENKKRALEKQAKNKQEKWNLAFVIIGIILAIIELLK